MRTDLYTGRTVTASSSGEKAAVTKRGHEKKHHQTISGGGGGGGGATSRVRFQSVLTQPFSHWNDIEDVVAEFMTEWSPSQRSGIIQDLIRFLELKVILEEYASKKLLAPTQLVGHAWHVLILETELYRDVTIAIEDFHARPHRMIHHTLLRRHEKVEFEQRLKRTQRLFKAYYGTEMPASLNDIDWMGSKAGLAASERMGASSSIADGTRDEAPSWYNDGFIGGGKDAMKPWYFPWLPPACDCFEIIRETVFCTRDDICVDGDIYANIDENVSILTPPDIPPGE